MPAGIAPRTMLPALAAALLLLGAQDAAPRVTQDTGAGASPASTKPGGSSGAQPGARGAQDAGGAKPAAPLVTGARFDFLHLSMSFPDALRVSEQPPSKDNAVSASWVGKLGACEVRLALELLPRASFGFQEPSEVMEVVAESLADANSGGEPGFQFTELAQVAGPFGEAAYATFTRCTEKAGPGPSLVLRLTGLLPEWGYVLSLRSQPPLAEADLALARDLLLHGVVYDGPVRDAAWTAAEAKERWQASVPPELKDELDDVLRTPHYIILTNSSGGKLFAKKMEECYAAIRKVFPFDEVPERRLMPVFLFRTNDQYYGFLGKAFDMTAENARRTGGIASRDFYSTWYEAPGDPVHVHEATHQIFRNRLGLPGGGSWFQEGVAEYVSTRDNERGDAARAVAKGRSLPLADLLRKRSLIFSSNKDDKSGGDEAGDQYKQCALLIEFLREGRFGKAKFPEWIRAVGVAPANDLPAIEAATRRVYGVDLAALEKEFVAYCRKR